MQTAGAKKLLEKVKNVLARPSSSYVWTEDDLINAESAIGRNIFGAIPEGATREFFCHKKNVWLWYENGSTIRYEVRPQGVYKKIADAKYQKISGQELENFRQATKNYLKLVKERLYSSPSKA